MLQDNIRMSSLEDKSPRFSMTSISSDTSELTLPPYPGKTTLTGETLTLHAANWLKTDLSITSSSGNQKYFLSLHRLKEPDLRLRRGDANGPVLAAACIRSWSRTYHIGLSNKKVDDAFTSKGSEIKPSTSWSPCIGLADEIGAMTWIQAKTPWWPKMPSFTYSDQTYVLKRTRTDENGEKFQNARWRCHFGVYDEQGTVMALYEPNSCWGANVAKLRFAEGVDEGLEMCIILAVGCWREEMRRSG